MIRTISSRLTFFYKYIFSAVWITGFGSGTASMFLSGTHFRDKAGIPQPPEMRWQFLMAWIVGSLFIWWGCSRLKRVRLDDKALYISNYLEEIEVPLQEVSDISENRWINIHPVTLTFKNRTQFGSSAVFMPTAHFSIFSSHPIVAEIRRHYQPSEKEIACPRRGGVMDKLVHW